MTTNFYAPPSAIRGQRVVLPADEARHLRTVLRGDESDEITVVDGTGGWYRVEITRLAPEQGVGTITERRENIGEPPIDVTVGLAFSRSALASRRSWRRPWSWTRSASCHCGRNAPSATRSARSGSATSWWRP